jgi:hypothetical protein
MHRVAVSSSNLHSVGYEGDTLQVAFKDSKTGAISGIYDYAGVPATVHMDLMTADSQGKYLAAHVKGKYPHTKVG